MVNNNMKTIWKLVLLDLWLDILFWKKEKNMQSFPLRPKKGMADVVCDLLLLCTRAEAIKACIELTNKELDHNHNDLMCSFFKWGGQKKEKKCNKNWLKRH